MMKLDLWINDGDRDEVLTVGEFGWVWHEGDTLRAGPGPAFGNADENGVVVATMLSGLWYPGLLGTSRASKGRPDGVRGFTDWDAQSVPMGPAAVAVMLKHIPEGRTRMLAPMEWTTIRYGELWGKSAGDTDEGHCIALLVNGFWQTNSDTAEYGETWTDVDIDGMCVAALMTSRTAPELRFGLADLVEAVHANFSAPDSKFLCGVYCDIVMLVDSVINAEHPGKTTYNETCRLLGWPEMNE